MSNDPQSHYESRVRLYAGLIHGTDQHALLSKLPIYRSLLEAHRTRGDSLWRIEPLLPYLMSSLEQDVHLTLAKFFDDSGYSVRKFLDFCLTNRRKLQWAAGNPASDVLFAQKQSLAEHEETIKSIKGRRDKIFAHRDKEYFGNPSAAFDNFPLSDDQVIALAQCLISIIGEHEEGLHPGRRSFHMAEFFEISVDNMIRNLETGRRQNFPG